MGLKVTNNAFGTLNAGITNSDTTVVLQSGQGSRFPSLSSGDYFYATLIDTSNNLEIVKVTARSTDTMTIVRAQDNTTARAYSTNDRFELRPTAAMLNEVITKADTAQVTADAALPKAGGTVTGKVVIEGNSAAWNSTAPGTTTGSLHLDPQGGSATNNYGSAITFGAFDSVNGGNAQAGIYTNTGGSYGTQLFIGTSEDYNLGTHRVGFAMDHAGRVTMPYKPHILCKVFRASSSAGYYSFDAKASRFLSVGTYGGNPAILAPVAGVYAISFNGITTSTSGRVDLNLYKNGGNILSSLNEENGSGYHYRTISTTLYLNVGDAIQMYHATSVTPYYLNAGGSDLEWCNLSMTLLG